MNTCTENPPAASTEPSFCTAWRSYLAGAIAVALVLCAGGPDHARGSEPAALPTPETAASFSLADDDLLTERPYFDLDAYLDQNPQYAVASGTWQWQSLPEGLIYKTYLAGVKEPRMATRFVKQDGSGSWLWENNLGGRIGILRYGDRDPRFPQGFQVDAEGAAQVRLDMSSNVDVLAVDFRGGVPLTYGWDRQQLKFAYYHMSSHLGDEFLLNNPEFDRVNWSRDALVLGYSIYATDTLRFYAEAGWAFYTDVTEPWEFQFGLDWAPTLPTGLRGAPFLALNGHLRQEVNFGGNLTVQTGWSWLSERNRRMFRLGLHYYNGESSQYSFYDDFESLLGIGIWYDF